MIYSDYIASIIQKTLKDDSKIVAEVGYVDSYPQGDGSGFSGAWSVYPFHESKNIIISDIQNGLFVVKREN